jgi:hypothetical protein
MIISQRKPDAEILDSLKDATNVCVDGLQRMRDRMSDRKRRSDGRHESIP